MFITVFKIIWNWKYSNFLKLRYFFNDGNKFIEFLLQSTLLYNELEQYSFSQVSKLTTDVVNEQLKNSLKPLNNKEALTSQGYVWRGDWAYLCVDAKFI